MLYLSRYLGCKIKEGNLTSQTEQFLSMFRDEIEESIGSIHYLKDSYERKFKNGEITSYVYNENDSFLSQELAGLGRFLSFLKTVSPDVKTPGDIALLIENVVQQKLKGYEDPEAVYLIVHKKLEKTLKYLKLQSET
jgi:hypothetical protein